MSSASPKINSSTARLGRPPDAAAKDFSALPSGKPGLSPGKKTPLILVVDDNQTNIDIVRSYLKRMGLASRSARNGLKAIELAKNLHPDLILLDVMMPEMDGLEVCKILKNNPATSAIPVIFLSARKQIDHRVSGMAIGAVDYITKPFEPSELEIRIRSALRTKAMQDMLISQAKTDPLTGLYNWRCFHEVLSEELQRSVENSQPLSLILVDLDMFKIVNDSYGHQMGDKVLCDLSAMISASVRPTDHVARYGGDELIIVLPLTGAEQAKAMAERLCAEIKETTFGDKQFTVEIAGSFGVVTADPGDEPTAEALVRMADEALYTAKRRGRNQVCVWKNDHQEQQRTQDPEISGHLYRRRTRVAAINAQSRKQAMESMWMLAKALEARDHYSAHHSENVTHYAIAIAKAMGLTAEFVHHIHNAAMLHDIGKIGIPDRILKKVGRLDISEWEMMKQHPLISAEIIGQLTVLKREVLNVRHHHEHLDGSGYPDGLIGKEIPIGARILAVADAFDAITSDRIYRDAGDRQTAVDELTRCVGSQFDPEVVAAFVQQAEKNKNIWPIRYKHLEKSSQLSGWNSTMIASLEIAPTTQQQPDEWLVMEEKLEQTLASLAENLGKLTASRTEHDLEKLAVQISQFRVQTEELSRLAKSVSLL